MEDLASRLGVSRTPLLTAFRKLEKEMLVVLVPRRGAFVRENTNGMAPIRKTEITDEELNWLIAYLTNKPE